MYFLSGWPIFRGEMFVSGRVSQPGFSPNFGKKCSITQLFRAPKNFGIFPRNFGKRTERLSQKKKMVRLFTKSNFGEPQQNNISQGDSMGFTIFLNRQLTKEKNPGIFLLGCFVGILRVSSLPFLPSFHKLHNLG